MAQLNSMIQELKTAPVRALVPVYTEVGAGKIRATFSLGNVADEDVIVSRERARAYPGLLGVAPSTDAFYKVFSSVALGKSVLDVGCGSGSGLVHFAKASRVVGVDSSEVALEFARRSVSGVEFLRQDAEKSELPTVEVATLVDVLGATEEPVLLLRRVAAALGKSGVLCLAEPKATAAQGLLAPMRRAFTKRELEVFLAEAGFKVTRWISEGAFFVLVAETFESEWVRGLAAANRHFSLGAKAKGLELLAKRPKTPGGLVEISWLLTEAEALVQAGELERSLNLLLEAQAKFPDDERVLAVLSEMSLGLGQFDDARKFAEAAMSRDPCAGRIAIAVARSESPDSSPGERVASWFNAARLSPSDISTAVGLARIATDYEAYQLGIISLERLRSYHSVLPVDFHLTIGWLYLMADRTEDALLETRLVSIMDPKNAGVSELLSAICASSPRAAGQA